MDCTVSNVGERLQVGVYDPAFNPAIPKKLIPGTSVLNGPVYIGVRDLQGVPSASCMIGPPIPGASFPASLEVKGITNIFGNLNVAAISNFTGITNFTALVTMNSLEIKNGIDLKNGLNIGNSNTICQALVVVNSSISIAGSINSVWLEARLRAAKSFDIPHPSKPNTHRLRYVCLEGPEVGVYYRGKLENTDIIELPHYWRDLVELESITVNLTPFHNYQELYVDKIEWGTRIKIKNNAATAINCYYTVFAERKMKTKLQPEYEGRTPEDYPGSNDEYSIAGWDYAKP
jgi:hypothetical protein